MKAALIFLPLLASCVSADGAVLRPGMVSCPPSVTLARGVAEADLIVLAAPQVPVERLRSAKEEENPGYVQVPLTSTTILKGQAEPGALVIEVYPKGTAYGPSLDALASRTGLATVFFLARVDGTQPRYFLQQRAEAFLSPSEGVIEALKVEVARQERLAAQWTIDPSLPHFARVRTLLAGLPRASLRRQEEVFRQLEGLGLAGVPAIVAQMDDRRPLAHQQISLANRSADAFEGMRHYGPELVVDALDAILNQIAAYGGNIVNGGSERDRRAAVQMWRIYAADLRCGPAERN